MKVYLAGPITGQAYDGAVEWREYAKSVLSEVGIEAYSPMRAKSYLKHISAFSADGDVYRDFNVLSTNRGIMTRDRFDATRCDLLLVNLLGATEKSVGTIMEIAWADLARRPIVCVMEPEGNPHEHGMIYEAVGFRVAALDEALALVKAILLP